MTAPQHRALNHQQMTPKLPCLALLKAGRRGAQLCAVAGIGISLWLAGWPSPAAAQRIRPQPTRTIQRNLNPTPEGTLKHSDLQAVYQNALRNLHGKQGIHLLNLPFSSDDIDDATTQQLSDTFLTNLRNTRRFVIVLPPQPQVETGPSLPSPQAIHASENNTPKICRTAACGVALAKQLRADQVLAGRLSGVDPQTEGGEIQYRLNVRLIDAVTNQLEHEETVVFFPKESPQKLYRLANQLAANLLQRGRVLRVVNPTQVLVGLGRKHGVKRGERMVVLRNLAREVEGERNELQLQPIALVKVLRVDANTAQVSTLQKSSVVQVADYVHAYPNPVRRVALLASARRSLDESWRDNIANLAPTLKLNPVLVEDVERLEWLRTRARVLGKKQFWGTMAWVSGGVMLLGLLNFDNNSTRIAALVVAGGFGVHSFVRWKRAKSTLEELNVKGRSKNWLGYQQLPSNPVGLLGGHERPAHGNYTSQPPTIPVASLGWHWRF